MIPRPFRLPRFLRRLILRVQINTLVGDIQQGEDTIEWTRARMDQSARLLREKRAQLASITSSRQMMAELLARKEAGP